MSPVVFSIQVTEDANLSQKLWSIADIDFTPFMGSSYQGWIKSEKFYWISGQETVKQLFLFKMNEEPQGRNGEVLSYRGR